MLQDNLKKIIAPKRQNSGNRMTQSHLPDREEGLSKFLAFVKKPPFLFIGGFFKLQGFYDENLDPHSFNCY